MADVTINVPAAHREALREHLIGLYAAVVEAFLLAIETYLRQGEPIEPLLAKRAELLQLDRIIEQVSWPRPNARPVRVSGDPELIAESVQSLLGSSTSALNDVFESGGDIRAQVETAQPLIRNVQSLHRLLRRTQGTE